MKNNKKCVWFDGKNVYEVSFCNEFLSENPVKFVDGVFYNKNGAVDVRIIEKKIADKLLAQKVQKNFDKKVTALTGALKRICYSPDFEDDAGIAGGNEEAAKTPQGCGAQSNFREIIHLKNGMLTADGTFVPEFRICRNRLNVDYVPSAPKPLRWIAFLTELLEPADILTLQEYIGYCLIHSTKGQSMLFIVGNGGEGKSRIGVVLYHIFKEAAYFGSITELAGDKFLKSNLIGKMLLIDDDMNMEGLKDTSFLKSLATAETPITVQAKGKQGIQVKLNCRTICFSNGMPKSLYDKSEGWERRLMILSTKPVPKDRVNDPFLSEKLIAESEGIFLWALEGLQRFIANNFKFTVSERAKQNITEMKESNCNIISFLKDEQLIKFGDGFECATADLYSGYCYWCNLNGVTILKKESFSLWLKQNHSKYRINYSDYVISHESGKKARGYRGIDTTFRSIIQ